MRRLVCLMPDDLSDEAQLVALIAELHRRRGAINENTPQNKRLTAMFQLFLERLPEGEREIWNMEADPPIGVGLKDAGGARWLELSALDDATILWAAHQGLLGFATGGAALYDALVKVPSREIQQHIEALRPHVHSGGGVQVTLLK